MLPDFSAGKKVVAVFSLSLAFLGLIGWVSYRSTVRLVQASQESNRAHQCLEELQNLFSKLQDAETGERGYILTAQERYLEPYHAALSPISQSLLDLKDLTSDHPGLQSQVNTLNTLAASKLAQLDHAIEVRQALGLDAALALVQSGDGKRTMDSIRRVMSEMKSVQAGVIEQRTLEMQATARRTAAVIVFGSLLSVLVVGLATLKLNREFAQRQRAEESAAALAAIVESSEDAMVSKTLEGKILTWNKGAERMYGYPASEVIGQSVSILLPQGHQDDLSAVMARLSAGGSFEQWETVRRKKDGTLFDVSLTLSPLMDRRGRITGAASVARDVSRAKEAERLLHESETKFRTLFESIDEGFCIIEIIFDENNKAVDYRFLEVNPSFEKQTGIAHAVGRRMREIAPSHEENWFEIYGKIALTGEPARFVNEAAQLHRWFDVYAFRIGDPQQKRVAILFNDITARRHAEEEIQALNRDLQQRTAELSAVNKELEAFSYSVSHDLRAPLRSIDGFSLALLEDYEHRLDEAGKDFVRRVRANTQRMAQLIDDLINLSRVTRVEMRQEQVSLSAIAQSVAGELGASDPGRKVNWTISENLVTQGDERLLRVALENLLRNAWKFTAKRSMARIEVGALNGTNGSPVFFVRDDGAGFDMAYAQKLFTPFQRLHSMADYKGTGIGLATVQRIIHRHGGRVWAESQVDQGASFYFTLGS